MNDKITHDYARFDIWYPRIDGNVEYLEVGLVDVRAADSLRIHYDFERDGYAIEQASTFSWPEEDTDMDMDWQEVAFVRAWARDNDPIGAR